MNHDKKKCAERNIELEFRAEVAPENLDIIKEKLKSMSLDMSDDVRISAMWIGDINNSSIDLRVRTSSDGLSELVLKRGDYHSHNRLEASVDLTKDQFIGMVKTFCLLPLPMKLTKRENVRYQLPNEIEVAVVKSGKIIYLEIECMSNEFRMKDDQNRIEMILDQLGVENLLNRETFKELCDRLTLEEDLYFEPHEIDNDIMMSHLDRFMSSMGPI